MCLALTAAVALACTEVAPAEKRPPDPATAAAAQRSAMEKLSFLDGVWRGTAWTILPGGKRHDIVQTERIGTFLGGAVRVIEGRGYEPDGSVGFNALGIISYDPRTRDYSFRSYAMGMKGDFPFKVLPDGYVWQTPAGPGTIIRYTATVGGGKFREIGERIGPDGKPVQILEMNLVRVGDTDWPAGGAVPMR